MLVNTERPVQDQDIANNGPIAVVGLPEPPRTYHVAKTGGTLDDDRILEEMNLDARLRFTLGG